MQAFKSGHGKPRKAMLPIALPAGKESQGVHMCNSSTPEAEAEGSLVKNRQDKKERKEERERRGWCSLSFPHCEGI